MADVSEIGECLRVVSWYAAKKGRSFGKNFDSFKSSLVSGLTARRGANQNRFLHMGMVSLLVLAMVAAPILYNRYPTQAAGEANVTPSSTLNTITATDNSTTTIESKKPRRDIVEYIVQPGDTLSTIAQKFNSEDNRMDAQSISYLNGFDVGNILRPGEKIKIPPVAGIIVTVRSGDTIDSLAKKYGLPNSQPIVDWPYNDFVDADKFTLAAGQSLVIPGGTPPEEAPRPVETTPTLNLFAQGSGVLAWPTHGIITQYFSWYHNGLDIANNTGTPITAADSGRVVIVLYQNHDYGHHVVIDHGNGIQTLYAHMTDVYVHVGDNVSRGQVIGLMGETGRATGPHLHFTVRTNGHDINPLLLLR